MGFYRLFKYRVLMKKLRVLKVDLAGNGFEALEKLRSNRYDVILLDISMPGTVFYKLFIL
jgi:CheY-like chemotaxis protein